MLTVADKDLRLLKKGIWIYFYLLIFEGALRKWFLPSLSTPLLVVRDPIAIWLIYKGISSGLWKPKGYVTITWLLTVIAIVLTILVGHGNFVVAMYGARITLIHFPLIFIIKDIFSYEDVVKIGRHMLYFTIGMTLLVAIQYFSPQNAWINRSVAGDEGSGFAGAMGFYRVPGTFSFTSGLANFYGLAVPFILFFLISRIKVSKITLISCVIAVIAAIPLTISRAVFFQTMLSIVFLILASSRNKKILLKLIGGGILVFILLIALQNFEFFQTSTAAFTQRFDSANKVEGGVEGVLIDRFLGGMLTAITSSDLSLFGKGLGLGTNAGAQIIAGSATFLISEGEWGRLIGETGLLFGLIFIFIRLKLVLDMALNSWKKVRFENILPWLLCSSGVLLVLQGQWGQPTTLGFAIVTGGFILASLKKES